MDAFPIRTKADARDYTRSIQQFLNLRNGAEANGIESNLNSLDLCLPFYKILPGYSVANVVGHYNCGPVLA
jgi:hypothetical protein